MKELKGKISIRGEETFTCCESRPKIFIDEVDLLDYLRKISDRFIPASTERNDEIEPDPVQWQVRYIVQDTRIKRSDFNTLAATVINSMLDSTVVSGCYSEWTCGVGGYDFELTGGHSILRELATYEGKYVWLKMKEDKPKVSRKSLKCVVRDITLALINERSAEDESRVIKKLVIDYLRYGRHSDSDKLEMTELLGKLEK